MSENVYLDNNATTRPLPEVVKAMAASMSDVYANPSSVHRFGQSVRHQLELAREKVADLIGASPREIVFTSGGTESINFAIRGLLSIHPDRRKIVTTAVEHVATLEVMEHLQAAGYQVEYVPVDEFGQVDEAAWSERVDEHTALVTFIHANNETGVLLSADRLAAVAEQRGVPVHVDAVQSCGKVALEVHDWPVHAVSISAHKFHGPKGVGCCYLRRRTRVPSLILGGTQENERRGGTENVAAIIGMGVAAEAAGKDIQTTVDSIRRLRDRLEDGIARNITLAQVVASGGHRICNTSNITFEGLAAEAILILLSDEGISVSSGAACSSGSLEPSHVLLAMGLSNGAARGSIRFSLSRLTTDLDIDRTIRVMPTVIEKVSGVAAARR